MPAAIGAAVLTAVGATTLATTAAATVVGNIIILGAALTIQLAFQREQQASSLPSPQQGRQSVRQAVPARIVAFGRVRLAGAYMLYEERDEDSWDVLAMCEGPITGFVSHYLHDDIVDVDGNGWVVEVLDSAVGAKNDGRYQAETVNIQTRLGEIPSDAEDSFVEQIGDLWTDEHRGDGIASVYLRCRDVPREVFETRYPHGLPQYSAVVDGMGAFDPRDEAQSHDDDATWALTANPVLQLMRFLTDERIGMGLDYEAVIEPVLDRWIEQADACDDEGYESNGFYRMDTDPAEVIAMLLGTCDGWLAEDGEGHLVIRVGKYEAPTVIIEPQHILGLSFQLGVDDERAVNELKFTFTSPAHDYNEIAGDPWRDDDDIAARGRVRSQSLPLTWVQDHTQGRKLTKRAMERLMSSARGKLKCTLYGLRALGERWIGLQYHSWLPQLADAVLEIENIEIDIGAGCVTIDWVKVDGVALTEFDEETEGGEAPPTVPGAGEHLLTDDAPESILDDAGEQILEDF